MSLPTSISTASIPGDLADKLRAAARVGFTAVDLFESDLLYHDRPSSEVRGLLDELGLTLDSLQPLQQFEALPDGARDKAFIRAERKLQLAQELGAKLLVVTSNTAPSALDDTARAAADLAELADLAAPLGIDIAYLPLPWATHVCDYRQASAIVQQADRDNLGLVLDSLFHLHADDAPPLAELPIDKILQVHLCDAPALSLEVQQLSTHFRCFPGQGDLSLRDWVGELQRLGYQRGFCLNVHNDEFRAASSKQISLDAHRARLWLAEQLDGSSPQDLVAGVEFIEITTSGKEAAWYGLALASLGFAKTHQHRSKSAALYQQGEINIVLNTEPDSFAAYHHREHGTSVCAIGLATGDASALFERCLRFGCTPFEGRVSEGELQIPAVRSVDGGLIYLVERGAGSPRFFEVDFEPLADSGKTDGLGLTHVDHLSYAVATYEFLPTQLYFRSLFGFAPNPQFDLADLHGVVHSRMMESPNHAVRLPLNASQSRRTATERFRRNVGGSGVQHIAFACEDIFRVAAGINPNHVLPIAAGYYKELEIEFGLEADFVAKLKAANILYDEDEHGHFLQLYTRQTRGVFFEVVQRSGYRSLGARNASARLAAQAREFEHIQGLLMEFDEES